MSDDSIAQKQAQFEAFFMIAHRIRVNVVTVDDTAELPAIEQLEQAMPYAFRIASEMANIEASALRPLRNLSEHASDLVDYLNYQARKIDLMMSFILQQQDDAEHRFEAIKFGGGGVIVEQSEPLTVGTVAQLKLFLTEEAAAIFCYGEVIACHQHEDVYHIAFVYNRIRETDQELLVRASLHLQTKQLRKRSDTPSAT